MDEHSDDRPAGSMLAAMLDGSKASRIIKNLPASSSASASVSASSSRAITPVTTAVVPACCDVALACLDSSLVCCTDQECSDDGKSKDKQNSITSDQECPQCETAAKEDASTPCTDPGCQLLEWDEQAVDELLRCCCSSDAGHGHRSFATPYTTPGSNTPIDSTLSTSHTYKHPAPPILPSTSSNHTRPPDDFRFLPPSNSSYNPYIPYSQAQLHPRLQSLPHLPPDSRSEASTSHSSSTNSFSFSSPALSSISSGAHTIPNNNNIQPLQLSSANKVYKCQWSQCPAIFHDKESLIGHVNAGHLMSAEAQPKEDPTSNKQTTVPSASFGTGDDSFENTLKCLWDSCSASLPLVQVSSADASSHGATSYPNTNGHGPLLNGINGDTATLAGTGGHTTSCAGGAHSHSMQSQPSLPLQDAPTATLVRHLLQDHLHLPTDILSLLSPSLGVSNPLPSSTSMPTAQITTKQDNEPVFYTSHGSNHASNQQQHEQAFSQPITQVYSHVHSPIHSHSSRPPSMASGSNCNSPAFPTFPPQQNIGSIHDHVHGNDLRDMAKHARNASLDSLASSVLEASYGLQQQQQHQTWNHSHSRNTSVSELYGGAVSNLNAAPPLPSAAAIDNGSNGSEAHSCGCEGCGASFSTTSALMEHISSSHIGSGKSIYYCHWAGCERALSGRGFNQRQKIQRHLRTHVGDKPFLCPFPGCTSKFSESTTLNQHIRTQHTTEKPFKCDFEGCGKSFALQSALTIHKRTHSGEKPFKCPVQGCGMRFAESSNLSKHVKTHRNDPSAPAEDVEIMVGEVRIKRKRKSAALDADGEDDVASEDEQDMAQIYHVNGMANKAPRRRRSRV